MTSESSEPLVLSGNPIVLDSCPVLEWLYRHQPASERFRAILDSAQRGEHRLHICRINYGEIVYNCLGKQRRGVIPSELAFDIADLPWTVVSADDALVDEAAKLKTVYPISYADCFAAALATRLNAPIATGDPDFLKLQSLGLLTVHWLGA